MFLYIAQAGTGSALKVGRAGDPVKRLAGLQTGSFDRLTLAQVIPVDPEAAPKVERFAHWLLRDRRIGGEWFRTTVGDALAAIVHATEAVARGERPMLPKGPKCMPGPKPQDLETILGRYPKGTGERIKRVLGTDAGKGAQAELLRQALDRELKRREKAKP